MRNPEREPVNIYQVRLAPGCSEEDVFRALSDGAQVGFLVTSNFDIFISVRDLHITLKKKLGLDNDDVAAEGRMELNRANKLNYLYYHNNGPDEPINSALEEKFKF